MARCNIVACLRCAGVRYLFLELIASPSRSRTVGADKKHLKLTVGAGRSSWDAIAFGFGGWAEEMPEEIDLLYNFERNAYNGVVSLQLNVRDIKPAL